MDDHSRKVNFWGKKIVLDVREKVVSKAGLASVDHDLIQWRMSSVVMVSMNCEIWVSLESVTQ